MTYTAKRPYRLFKNEVERSAFQQFDWEAEGLKARGSAERSLKRMMIRRMDNLPPEGTPEYNRVVEAEWQAGQARAEAKLAEIAVTHADSEWSLKGRAVRERIERFLAS